MRGRKEVLFEAEKKQWVTDCLSRFEYLLRNVSNDIVLVSAINDRESVKSKNKTACQINASELQAVLEDLDSVNGEYEINDPTRVGAWLVGMGFDAKYLSKMPPSRRVICESIVFSAIGDVARSASEAYMLEVGRLTSHLDIARVNNDQLEFQDLLTRSIQLQCKRDVVRLRRECTSYARYLAGVMIAMMEKEVINQVDEVKSMFLPHIKKTQNGSVTIVVSNLLNNARLVLNARPNKDRKSDTTGLEGVVGKLSAVRELLLILAASDTPHLDRLVQFNIKFAKDRALLSEHRGGNVVPASVSFWRSEGSKFCNKIDALSEGSEHSPPKHNM